MIERLTSRGAQWRLDVRRKPAATAMTLAMIGVMGLTLVAPLATAVGKAFRLDGAPSLYWFGELFAQAATWRQLGNGLLLASLTTLLSMLLAIPLALLRSGWRFRGQGILSVAVLLPMILPPFVGALAMRRILGRFGMFNLLLERLGLLNIGPDHLPPNWLAGGLLGVAVIQALHLFPILYLNASAALANIDPAHLQAARNLGAGPTQTFFRVTLPLMRPGLFAGGTIVFIWAFTDLGTPLMLGVLDLLPVRIFRDIAGADYGGKTFALVCLMLLISVGLYVLGKFVFGRSTVASGGKATLQANQRRLGPAGTLGAWLLFGGVLLLAILPHLGVILMAVNDRWIGTILPTGYTTEYLQQIVRSDETYRSILNSLQYAGGSVVLDLLLGVTAAWLIVRNRAPLAGLLDGLVMLPLAVPGIIIAAGYVGMTAPGSPFEIIGPRGAHPFVLLVIAYTVRRLPLVVRGVGAGLEQTPVALEEAARNLGSSRFGAARRITLPLITANLVAAGVLAFSFAVLEVSDSLILAQTPETYPITKQIYELYASGTLESIFVAAALGVFGMVLLGGTMAIASALLGKKLGAIFRA